MEQQTKLLLDNIMEGCQIIGFDWTYIYVNKTAERHTRRPQGELLGRRYVELWSGIEGTNLFKLIKDSLENRKYHKVDSEFNFPDGQACWFEFSIQPIDLGVIILSNDITERKRTENKIEQERFYLQEAQNIGKIGTWELDLRTDVLTWTEENYKIFGVKNGKALNYQSFVDCLHPDDVDFVHRKWIEGTQGKPYDIEHRIIAKGKVKWVREKAKLFFDEEGKVYKAIGVTQDITKAKLAELDLKDSEERFRAVFDQAAVGVAILDTESGRYLKLNKQYCKFLGFTEEELLLKTFMDVTHPDDVNKNLVANKDLSQRKLTNSSFDKRYIRKDGEIVWGNLTISPLWEHEENSNSFQHIAIVIDITDRKEAEDTIKTTAKELSDANATKDKFFSIIAHDLRGPFNIIMGMSDLLLLYFDKYDNKKKLEIIKAINNSSRQTFALLENLLEWSKSQSGMIKYSPEKIILEQLFDQVLSLQKLFAEKKNIEIKSSLIGLPVITADRVMLQTTLRNLLSNAVKFTRNGGQISISATSTNTNVIISVEDNGIGMNNSQQDNLFDLTNQQIMVGTNNEKGTGLGLILCKEFVEKHNGKLTVKSKLGEGSIFEINIPQ